MAGEDVWTLLTRQLYPMDGIGSGYGKHGDLTAKTGEGNEEGASEGYADTAAVPAAACARASFALCVGMPGAGKSSLLNAYLNPNNDGVTKPTVALEYMFARRAGAANAPKDVAHIWELGGGSHVSDLVRVPITPERFHNSLYVIVVDLSKPSSVIPHLLHWTDQVKACVKVCVRELARRDPTFADALKKKTYAKLGRDHPDLLAVKPCPIPLVIAGNKYDIFKNHESVRRRTLAQALRFIAHINGASLLFCSSREKKLKDIFRLTLNAHLFHSNIRKTSETNAERPLVIPSCSDSLEAILKPIPPGLRREDFVSGHTVADGAMNAWRQAVEDVFGAADVTDDLPVKAAREDDYGDGEVNGGDKNPFPEAMVDEHRVQRDDMLRRYRKDAERKARMAMKAIDAPHKSAARATPSSAPKSSLGAKATSTRK